MKSEYEENDIDHYINKEKSNDLEAVGRAEQHPEGENWNAEQDLIGSMSLQLDDAIRNLRDHIGQDETQETVIKENVAGEEATEENLSETLEIAETVEAREDKDVDAKKESFFSNSFFQWLVSIVIAFLIALLLRAYVFELVLVSGSSMEATLYDKERLYVDKISYSFSKPKLKDVVILIIDPGTDNKLSSIPIMDRTFSNFDETDYVKRIIGLPGEVIDIVDGEVFRNNEKLTEEYIQGKTYVRPNQLAHVVVPEGQYYVLGDNREHSRDSREIGCISADAIKGKASFIIWPPKELGKVRK